MGHSNSAVQVICLLAMHSCPGNEDRFHPSRQSSESMCVQDHVRQNSSQWQLSVTWSRGELEHRTAVPSLTQVYRAAAAAAAIATSGSSSSISRVRSIQATLGVSWLLPLLSAAACSLLSTTAQRIMTSCMCMHQTSYQHAFFCSGANAARDTACMQVCGSRTVSMPVALQKAHCKASLSWIPAPSTGLEPPPSQLLSQHSLYVIKSCFTNAVVCTIYELLSQAYCYHCTSRYRQMQIRGFSSVDQTCHTCTSR